eukprot:8098262-Lingulodinium_polyedra.AAC.1
MSEPTANARYKRLHPKTARLNALKQTQGKGLLSAPNPRRSGCRGPRLPGGSRPQKLPRGMAIQSD